MLNKLEIAGLSKCNYLCVFCSYCSIFRFQDSVESSQISTQPEDPSEPSSTDDAYSDIDDIDRTLTPQDAEQPFIAPINFEVSFTVLYELRLANMDHPN